MGTKANKQLSRREFLRHTVMAATVAGVGGILAACGSAPATTTTTAATGAPAAAATTAPVTASTSAPVAGNKAALEYWTGWSGYEFDELGKLVSNFNSQSTMGTVNMTTVFGQYEKVLTAISAGTPPDVVSAVWMRQIPAMAARNALTPLDEYATKSNINGADYFPQLYNSWKYNGKQYGVAVTVSSTMVILNKKTLADAGIDANSAPKTLDEFDAMNEKLFATDSGGALTRVGYVPADLFLWGTVFGGSFYDEANKKITANDPKIIQALDWIAGYAKKYDITKLDTFTQGFGDYASPNNPLFVGKQGGTDAGEWINGMVKQYAPTTELTYLAPPPPAGGKEMVTTFDGSVFTIPTGAKNVDASWEFIEWLQRPENMEQFDKAINNLPTRKASAAKPDFTDPPGYKMSQDLLNSANARGPLPLPVFDQYTTEMVKAVDAARRGTKTSQEALDELTEAIQTELDRSQI